MTDQTDIGTVSWCDLTVDDAGAVSAFYRAVVGWQTAEVDMGGYADYGMTAPNGRMVAGVCHRRGANADLPAVWLVYIRVDDLERAMAACQANGGQVLAGPKPLGGEARYCVIRDPGGAVAALHDGGEPAPSEVASAADA